MAKNIIIGIGGTGLTAIRELRRLIAERYEGGLKDPAVAALRFVYIDTDSEFRGQQTWQVLNKDISLQPGEIVEINGGQLGEMVEHPDDYPDIAPWLPRIADYAKQPGNGAKGIRAYGRLIYHYSENKDRVKRAIINARNSLNLAFPHEGVVRFYIISSLSGGTGSGMFLPLADDMVEWEVFKRGVTNQKMWAFLVLPALAITGRHDRYHANAFATLKEMNYRGVNEKLPFSGTYLIEPVNESGLDIGLDNLPLLIAQRLFLNIQGGEAAKRIDSVMDNPDLGELDNREDAHRQHARCFSSFGLSSISYPREVVARSVGLYWAARTISFWLQERDSPQNVNQTVRNDLHRLHLSKLHVNGDGDPFGPHDHAPYETELPNSVDAKLGGLDKKSVGAAGAPAREDLETRFRGTGIETFYHQRSLDVVRAVEFAMIQVRLGVSRQIRDPQRGIRFAKQYLEELRNILEKEVKAEAATRVSPQGQNQVTVFQRNYAETVTSASLNEQKWVYTDTQFARDKGNMKDQLTSYLVAKAGYCSAQYAIALLDHVIPAVIRLRTDMDVWHSRLTDLENKLRGRLKASVQGRAEDPRENGASIVNDAVLEKVAQEAPAEVVNSAIERRLNARLAEKLERNLDDLDLFLFGEQADAETLIEKTAFEYILSAESPIHIQRTTLYDRFISEYPDPADRRTLLKQVESLSQPFVHCLPGEIARRPIKVKSEKVVSIPDVIGRITRDKREAKDVIREDIIAIGAGADDIQPTQDVERIVFVSEKQAFPVRFIESVRFLKKEYDRFASRREALHIDKAEVGQLYELFLLSDDERKSLEAAEEAFLLARAAGWIAPNQNLHTLKKEICYEYEVPGKIGKKSASFGADWDIAFERFTQDAISPAADDGLLREGRTLVTERAANALLAAQADPAGWGELYESLKKFLDGTLNDYSARTYDPRYKRDMGIINRMVDRHGAQAHHG
jgi:hypothetical protein